MQSANEQKFNQDNYYPAFTEALDSAKALVLILSPFAKIRRIRMLAEPIKRCIARGVRICVFVMAPWGWSNRHTQLTPEIEKLQESIALLRGMKVHVTVSEQVRPHEKVIVFDDNIVDDGTLNVLSHFDTRDKMTRYHSREKVLEAIKDQALYTCEECFKLCGFYPLRPFEDSLLLRVGKEVSAARNVRNLQQRELADKSNLQPTAICEIEHGRRNVTIKLLGKILETVSIKLLPVPSFMVPAVMQLLANAAVSKVDEEKCFCEQPKTVNLSR